MSDEMNPATPQVPAPATETPEKNRGGRPKNPPPLVAPKTLAEAQIFAGEILARNPNPRPHLSKLVTTLLNSFTTTATTEKDTEIERLQKELDEMREMTVHASVITDYKNRRDKLENEIAALKSENDNLKRQAAENSELRTKLQRVLAAMTSDDFWKPVLAQLDKATDEERNRIMANATMVQELNSGNVPTLDGRRVNEQ